MVAAPVTAAVGVAATTGELRLDWWIAMNPVPSLRLAQVTDADEMFRVIRTAFAARRPVDPPADALTDSLADITAALRVGHGVCAELDGRIVACLLIATDGEAATLRRVSVLPEFSGGGIATTLVRGAISVASDLGMHRVELLTRREFPELLTWWCEQGFTVDRETEVGAVLTRPLPLSLDVPTATAMQDLGRRLAEILQRGDVLIASGDLGAGKTTLAQGIGEGLRVDGPVISPTFVISRVHRSLSSGPAFVHVDAYRLGDGAELADIDLDESLADSVTMVEWGAGKAEWLSDDRLEIIIDRGIGGDGRTVLLDGIGPRWAGALEPLRELR